jgi:uncharacterized membrane protein
MNRPKPLSLIASGRMTETLLTRQPALVRDLGWVHAPSRRVASRFARLLRAGEPAPSLADACSSPLIFLQAEAPETAAIVRSMLCARAEWRHAAVILIHPDLDSLALAELQSAGAATGSLTGIEPARGPLLLIEGDDRARAILRRRLREARFDAIELAQGGKALFLAARTAVSALLTPLLDHAARTLRAAGVAPLNVRRILEPAIESAVRAHFNAGRKSWTNPSLPARRESILAQLGVLREVEPAQARYFLDSLRAALELFGQSSDWLEPRRMAAGHGL